MARISGVDVQNTWKVDYALTKIKGVGWSLAKKVLLASKVNGSKRVGDLSTEEINKIASKLEEYPTEGDLFRQIRANVARLKQTGSYRGIRHSRGLPARGQRTRTNARTKRGKRRTVGAFKKEALAKMSSPAEKGGK